MERAQAHRAYDPIHIISGSFRGMGAGVNRRPLKKNRSEKSPALTRLQLSRRFRMSLRAIDPRAENVRFRLLASARVSVIAVTAVSPTPNKIKN